MYAGFGAMQETMLLSLLIGGLAALMRSEGGLAWISAKLQALVSKLADLGLMQTKAGEICIALLVALMNFATANNTIAILISGAVAKEIAEKYQVSAARSASLLDIFSCVVQGLIPYGAQILLASSIAAISPFAFGFKVSTIVGLLRLLPCSLFCFYGQGKVSANRFITRCI